ncbi:MAG: hypothetical protein PHQ54_05305 [Candidatus Omnitrophica bacterium]|nr:hypothetical protein [Candidatus Omnitrophota bacterium]
MRKVFTVIVLVSILSFGCAAYKSVHFGQDHYLPKEASDIGVFSSVPDKLYAELGEIAVFGVTSTNRDYMLNRLKEMAADMGGDAIILKDSDIPVYIPKPMAGIVVKWQKDEVLSQILSTDIKDLDINRSEEDILNGEKLEYIK